MSLCQSARRQGVKRPTLWIRVDGHSVVVNPLYVNSNAEESAEIQKRTARGGPLPLFSNSGVSPSCDLCSTSPMPAWRFEQSIRLNAFSSGMHLRTLTTPEPTESWEAGRFASREAGGLGMESSSLRVVVT